MAGGDVLDSREHGGVKGTGVVEEGADDLLNLFDLESSGRVGGVKGGSLGCSGAVSRRGACGRGLGGSNAVRAETEEHVGDVVGHRQDDFAVDAVMVDGEAKESGSDGGGFCVVEFGEDRDEAMEMVNVGVLHPAVVNYEVKMNAVSDMVSAHPQGKF